MPYSCSSGARAGYNGPYLQNGLFGRCANKLFSRLAASAATCSATPAPIRRAVLRGVRGALLSAMVLFGLVAPFPDIAHAHDAASNPTGHKEPPVEAVPETAQPSLTSTIPALGDFKKGLLDRGINFQLIPSPRTRLPCAHADGDDPQWMFRATPS
jgi:hypothetical protein